MLNSKKFYDRVSGAIPFQEAGSVNIVFLGDSVTHGCFGATGDPRRDHDRFASYTMKFHKMIGMLFPNTVFNIINSGIGGQTASMGLARFDRDVLAYHPDLVVISFGVNDHPEHDKYIASLSEMFDILNSLDIPCVYLTEHMMNTYSADDTAEHIKEYSKVTCEKQNNGTMDKLFSDGIALAKSKNITVCDMYGKWKNLYSCGADITGLLANRINHPIPEMHDMIAYSLISTLFFE